ncbi:glycoside hydrolase superfamily [Chytriomyces sp. MP71]|nr:glycoside hydrolase superfamily [Chytriomyces sp. MP71]
MGAVAASRSHLVVDYADFDPYFDDDFGHDPGLDHDPFIAFEQDEEEEEGRETDGGIDSGAVLANHNRFDAQKAHTRSFKNNVLAYITPWNNHGYDVVKHFRGKFTHLAPVWYRLTPDHMGGWSLAGAHDVDKAWIKEVTEPVQIDAETTLKPKLVPRFAFEGLTREDIEGLQGPSGASAQHLATTITRECTRQGHAGFVLEFLYSAYTPHFVTHLSRVAREDNLEFFLVIPPLHPAAQQSLFDATHLAAYRDLVDGFSLMTYDYTMPGMADGEGGGPNAPLRWMRENVVRLDPEGAARDKILMGLNLYGNSYPVGGTVVAGQYLDVLRKGELGGGGVNGAVRVRWDADAKEHVLTYKEIGGEKRDVWYPSLRSVEERVELARELGVGMSLWEVGQGLDYWYELF